MLTELHKETFTTQGLICLAGFLPPDRVVAAQECLFQLAEQEGLRRDGVWQTTEMPARPELIKQGRKVPFVELITPELLTAIDMLVDGQAMADTPVKPQLLFTPPQFTEWQVPHNVWHLDVPRLPLAGLPGVQVFTFLDTVIPKGGGTLVVAGSHHLLNTGEYIRSQDMKKRLRKETYFRNLMSSEFPNRAQFMTTPGKVGGVELLIVELHGEPGDVYLMDMRLLHTLSPNTAKIPRLMMTERFYLKVAHDQIHHRQA